MCLNLPGKDSKLYIYFNNFPLTQYITKKEQLTNNDLFPHCALRQSGCIKFNNVNINNLKK